MDLINADQLVKSDEVSFLLTGRLACQPQFIKEIEGSEENDNPYFDCFSLMKPVFNATDLVIGSLDTADAYPDALIEAMREAGFGLLMVPGHDSGEGEEKRRGELYRLLDDHNIAHPEGETIGTASIDVKGYRIGFIDCAFNMAFRDMKLLTEVLQKVNDLRNKGADLILCYVHWQFFIDRWLVSDERLRAIAKALANMGIDYTVGVGPRHPMQYEVMRGHWNRRMPILYNLGSFLNCNRAANDNTSAAIRLKVWRDENGVVRLSDSYLPCYTWVTYEGKRRRVQYLNDRVYRYRQTNNTAEWRKFFVARRIGDGLPLCHDFDQNESESPNASDFGSLVVDKFSRERLNKPSELQKQILDAYRLTDEFRTAYGELLRSSDAYAPMIKGAEHYLKQRHPEILEREDAQEVINDMIYSRVVLNFDFNEYFGFHFREKSIKERTGYISDLYRLNYYRRLNIDENEKRKLDHKWACYERLKDLFKREIIQIESRDQKEEFLAYAAKYERFMIKPVDGSLGKGIRIIDRGEYENAEALFTDIFSQAGPFVCEELIISKEYLSKLHPQSCNSVRMFTYNDAGSIKYVCAWLKAGTGDAIVDNGGAGGVVAAIDMETGIVAYDGANEAGDRFSVHPDTGIPFKGIQLQEWDALKELTKQAALAYPTVPFIAWDVAHGERGWQLIEGNSQGQMWIYQLSSDKGMREELEKIIGWSNGKLADR